MTLQSLQLVHFRSYTSASFLFDSHLTVVVGENAKGKSNLIEAIEVLATGRSSRA